MGRRMRNFLKQEAYWTKTIVAANHCTVRVLHPSIVKIPLAATESLYKRTHRLPCAVAKSIRFCTRVGDPLLPFDDITGVENRVLVLPLEIFVVGFADGCNPDVKHEK